MRFQVAAVSAGTPLIWIFYYKVKCLCICTNCVCLFVHRV